MEDSSILLLPGSTSGFFLVGVFLFHKRVQLNSVVSFYSSLKVDEEDWTLAALGFGLSLL